VEFALVVPVLLLILLLAIDFGRVFYSWIILQNAARIGANFAGLNAQAWEANPDVAIVVAEYQALIADDLDNVTCELPGGPPPDPAFSDSAADTSGSGLTPDTAYDVGDNVRVELTCTFHPLTPIISAVVGDNVALGASSEFRIRAGDIAGLANAAAIPQPSLPTPTPVPTPVPTGTPAPTGTPGPCIVVPDLITTPTTPTETVAQARAEWTAAGFTGAFNPSGQNPKIVLSQNQPVGACLPATTSVTVTHT
jgi:hypothetical protein